MKKLQFITGIFVFLTIHLFVEYNINPDREQAYTQWICFCVSVLITSGLLLRIEILSERPRSRRIVKFKIK